MRIYVASSWRNEFQSFVVASLRSLGHEVYDFRHPKPGDNGFHWSEIDGDWKSWDVDQYRRALTSPVAESGFASDYEAMDWAEVCVLVLPSGRSAHIEAGWFLGQGRPVCVYLNGRLEPELMYKLVGAHGAIVATPDELFDWVESASIATSQETNE